MNLRDIFLAGAFSQGGGAVSPEQIDQAVNDYLDKNPVGVDLAMTGATVGQIAKITAVDASGIPTAWEPVDMPSGGGEKEWGTITYDFSTDPVVAVKLELPRTDIKEAYLSIKATCDNSNKAGGRIYVDVEVSGGNAEKWMADWSNLYTTERYMQLVFRECGNEIIANEYANFSENTLKHNVCDRPKNFIYIVLMTADTKFWGTATLHYR